MPNKAKHAFGALERVDEALSSGAINAYDILFVKDANGKPYVGWIDKDGNKVVCDSADVDLSGIEEEIATLESTMGDKANASDVEALEAEMETKVDAATVQSMIEKHSSAVIEVVEF